MCNTFYSTQLALVQVLGNVLSWFQEQLTWAECIDDVREVRSVGRP